MDDDEIREFEEFIENEKEMDERMVKFTLEQVARRRAKVEFPEGGITYTAPKMASNVANHGSYIVGSIRLEKGESA